MTEERKSEQEPTIEELKERLSRALALVGIGVLTLNPVKWLLVGPETPHFRIGAVFIGSVVAIASIIYSLLSRIDFGVVKAVMDSFPFAAKGVSVLLLLAVGWVFYYIKLKTRLAYGLVESGFALAAGWQAVSGLHSGSFPELFAFVASVYFAVRGAENSWLGFDELREYINQVTKERVEEMLKLPKEEMPILVPTHILPKPTADRILSFAANVTAQINKKKKE
jgi:hypothetical protein